MNRAQAAIHIGQRYAEYLDTTGRAATDTTPEGLGTAIDDALRHLAVPEAVLPTWQAATDQAYNDLLVQLEYRVMRQVVLDLSSSFDLTSEGDSLRLSQIRANAQADAAAAKEAVLARFGTIDVYSPVVNASPFVSLNLAILDDEDYYDGVG